ncbi:MAG: tyrosine-type recombinase/integrase [Verrucomicrobia bacterium]|nr:tyrosine-type recombinase/integrase [Verrucomicrobiota bacterium]
MLEHRIRLSGIDLPQCGTHVLRHSLAAHLLRQGVGIKTIGDALGRPSHYSMVIAGIQSGIVITI